MAPPTGRRPVLLLSRNIAYELRLSVTVAPVTRTIRGISTEVDLDDKDGMPSKCVINLDDIATVPENVLIEKLTTLSEEKMKKVNEAIIFALGMKN